MLTLLGQGGKETAMTCLNDREAGEQLMLSNRLWQISAGILTINLNGWFTKVTRGEGVQQGVLRYQALFGVLKRQKLTLVGVQEHHWASFEKAREARQWLSRRGWGMRETCGSGREGVALLWKESEWSEVSSVALHPRLLVGHMCHASGTPLTVLVGHMHSDHTIRKKQWEH
jgi:hypothetical protein